VCGLFLVLVTLWSPGVQPYKSSSPLKPINEGRKAYSQCNHCLVGEISATSAILSILFSILSMWMRSSKLRTCEGCTKWIRRQAFPFLCDSPFKYGQGQLHIITSVMCRVWVGGLGSRCQNTLHGVEKGRSIRATSTTTHPRRLDTPPPPPRMQWFWRFSTKFICNNYVLNRNFSDFCVFPSEFVFKVLTTKKTSNLKSVSLKKLCKYVKITF